MKESKWYPWLVLCATSLGILLSMLNLSTLNVALPEVSNHFHAGAIASNWILLSYMLFNTVLILVFGKLADIYGRRKLYLFGLTEFTIVSLLIGFSPNVWVLILLRIFQAVGGALVITNTTPLITDAFDKRRLGTALGVNVLIASIAQLAGPVLGGGLGVALGWRWLFWFNVPLGVIGVIWGYIVLKPTPGKARGESIDWLGNITVFLGLGSLIFALSEGGIIGWSRPSVVLGLIAFVIFTLGFIWVEKRVKFPMIDFSLFSRRAYTMANLATFANSLARASIVLLIALFFQVVGHENAFVAGLKVLPVTIGMIVASPIAGVLTAKYSSRLLSTAGLLGTCVGMGVLVWNIGPHASLFWISLGQLFIGLGTGMFQTPNTQSIMLSVPTERRGIANGIRSMLQSMGQVISTALSLMIVTSAIPARLKDAIYAGTSAHINTHDVVLISNGYRLTFIVMMLLTILAVLASYFRGTSHKHHQLSQH